MDWKINQKIYKNNNCYSGVPKKATATPEALYHRTKQQKQLLNFLLYGWIINLSLSECMKTLLNVFTLT